MNTISSLVFLLVGVVAFASAGDEAKNKGAEYPYAVYGRHPGFYPSPYLYGGAPYFPYFHYPAHVAPAHYPYVKLVFYGRYKGKCKSIYHPSTGLVLHRPIYVSMILYNHTYHTHSTYLWILAMYHLFYSSITPAYLNIVMYLIRE